MEILEANIFTIPENSKMLMNYIYIPSIRLNPKKAPSIRYSI